MGKLTQQGIAAWVVILAIVGVVGLSAVAGVVLLQKFDNEAIEEADRETRTSGSAGNPFASNSQQQNRSGEKPQRPGAGIGATTTKPANKGAPVTEVDLTLKGVITRNDPKRSRALIAKGKEAEQAYLPGDSVLANVSLDSVASDHVVLKVNGQRETLYLNRTLEGTKSSNNNPASNRSDQESAGRRLPSLLTNPAGSRSEGGLLGGILNKRQKREAATGNSNSAPPESSQSIETGEDEDYLEDEDEDWDDEDWDEDDWDEEDWDLDEEDEDDW